MCKSTDMHMAINTHRQLGMAHRMVHHVVQSFHIRSRALSRCHWGKLLERVSDETVRCEIRVQRFVRSAVCQLKWRFWWMEVCSERAEIIPISACHESVRDHTSNAQSPARATNVTDDTSIPCACHKIRTSTSKRTQSAAATKSDNIISCELQQNLHHTTRS